MGSSAGTLNEKIGEQHVLESAASVTAALGWRDRCCRRIHGREGEVACGLMSAGQHLKRYGYNQRVFACADCAGTLRLRVPVSR
jgi:hypothetical protein